MNEYTPNKILDLSVVDGGSGREIRGLSPTEEKFSLLREGLDYRINRVNSDVRIMRDGVRLQDFVYFINPYLGELSKNVEAPHWRTVTEQLDTVLRYEEQTEDGFYFRTTPYYEINTKGVGYTKPAAKGYDLRDADTYRVGKKVLYSERQMGLASKDDFSPRGEGDIIATSNYLIAHGVRTECYMGVEDVSQMYYKNAILSVKELKKRGVMIPAKEFSPQIAQRLIKCNVRVEEIKDHEEVLARRLFERGYSRWKREHGEEKTYEDLVLDSSVCIVKSIASLINLGYIHGYLHSSNISIVGEILDLGTCAHHENNNDEERNRMIKGVRVGHLKDMRDALIGIKHFIARYQELYGVKLGSNKAAVLFVDAFAQTLHDRMEKVEGGNKKNALAVFTRLVEIIIVAKRNVPAIRDGQVVGWEGII